MRVLVMVKANKDSEAGKMPPESLVKEMGKFNQELMKAGVILAADGLLPSSRGKRVKFDAQASVIDGPFAETKELVAGFWIWKVKDVDEAVAWLKKAPFGGGAEVEIRPIHDPEEFSKHYSGDVRADQEKMRAALKQ